MGPTIFYVIILAVFIAFMEHFRRSNERRNKDSVNAINKTHANQKETIKILTEIRDLLKSKQ